MSTVTKTPGIYVNELSFPTAIATIETSVPLFIGYTEIADKEGQSLLNTPFFISSLTEYRMHFGDGFKVKFQITAAGSSNADTFILNGKAYTITTAKGQALYLYNSIRLFYANGGSRCYICSIGTYKDKKTVTPSANDLINALSVVEKQKGPDIVVLPDAVTISGVYTDVYPKVLAHCSKLQSRFAIFDLCKITATGNVQSEVDSFRNAIGTEHLGYGAAYFPWLKTNVVDETEVDFDNILLADLKELQTYLPEPAVKTIMNTATNPDYALLVKMLATTPANAADKTRLLQAKQTFHKSLLPVSPSYKIILEKIRSIINELPAAGAIAGAFCSLDRARGVWKAPANVSLNNVIAPLVEVTTALQEDLNVNVTGKSINAIRSFAGKGTLIWGARTLDGNNQDWRYINVRRTIIMIEQSIKLALQAYASKPNDAITWQKVTALISDFLTNIWKQGGLQGNKPGEAYNVKAGLGTTMTEEDIRKGVLRIAVMVALIRPAEFIVIALEQQMQRQ